ncbi:MAG: AI-2E family transporter [Thermotogae bacterium]|uniref:AI-2E family transporter n=1 Tax=Kosmotoga sp. TaxID=1955248 RepID=UPI000F2CD1E7|nr:AI-2E family transporter [Kosmotoga sp.]MBO8166102.1 AI-2E family transporter [Kosmotoga sp.]RKX48360.1 MAG: AI-2E family transporter [Thermotogota bacterium]
MKNLLKSPRFLVMIFSIVYFLIAFFFLTISATISAIFIITIAIVFLIEPWIKFATSKLKIKRWIAVALGLGALYFSLILVVVFLFQPIVNQASSFYYTALNFFPSDKSTELSIPEIEFNLDAVLNKYKQEKPVSNEEINALKKDLLSYLTEYDQSSFEDLPIEDIEKGKFAIVFPVKERELKKEEIIRIISKHEKFSGDATNLADKIWERTSGFKSREDWQPIFGWLVDRFLIKNKSKNNTSKDIDDQEKFEEKRAQIMSSIRNVLIEVQLKFREYLTAFLEKLPSLVSATFSVMFFVIIGTVYLGYYFGDFKKHLPEIYPGSSRGFAKRFLKDTYGNLERYVVAIILVALVTGISVGILVKILGLDYSLLMGVWAAITNLIPIVGVVLEFIPLFLLAASGQNWVAVLFLLVFLVTIHTVAFIVFLKLMKGYTRINPVFIIVMIIIMAQLFSVAGAFIAAPTAIILKKFWEHFIRPTLNRA